MDTSERRDKILKRLQAEKIPLTGTVLAREFAVSRQVIVGDIGIIRAMGVEVYSTPRGYILPVNADEKCRIATLACCHDVPSVAKELEIIVRHGGKVRDVIVEHPLYGEIRADLFLASFQDVVAFLERLAACGASPLLIVTGGVHFHTIEIPDAVALRKIEFELRACGILRTV